MVSSVGSYQTLQILSGKSAAKPSQCPPKMADNTVATPKQSTDGTTQVDIRGQSVTYGNSRTEGVEAYKAVGNAKESANPFASTILRFIDAQLQRDVANGATPEELASRLQAGLKGFEEGYGQAYEQLAAAGFLNDSVKAEIEQTRSQVLAGIQELADKLGVEIDLPKMDKPSNQQPVLTSPIQGESAAAPQPVANPGKAILSAILRDVQIIEHYQKATKADATYANPAKARPGVQSTSLAYGVKESRDFSLRLRTADGDAVTIRLSSDKAGTSAVNSDGQGRSISLSGSQKSSFQFSVEGELDEGEMQALADLLDQVGSISEQFFAGDLESAFRLASELAFDKSEIASFDIRWNMSRTEMAGESVEYAGHPVYPADRFVADVLRAADFAERLNQPRNLVVDLLDWVAQNTQQDGRNALLAPAALSVL
jgi:hypothetical protein